MPALTENLPLGKNFLVLSFTLTLTLTLTLALALTLTLALITLTTRTLTEGLPVSVIATTMSAREWKEGQEGNRRKGIDGYGKEEGVAQRR